MINSNVEKIENNIEEYQKYLHAINIIDNDFNTNYDINKIYTKVITSAYTCYRIGVTFIKIREEYLCKKDISKEEIIKARDALISAKIYFIQAENMNFKQQVDMNFIQKSQDILKKVNMDFTHIEFNPQDEISYYRYRSYFLQDDYEKAIQVFMQKELNSEDDLSYYKRGLIYFHKGNYEKAIKAFTKTINSHINDENIENIFEPVYYNNNNCVKIPSCLFIIELYNMRGYAYDKNGEYGKAITDFMKGIEVELSRNSNV